MSEELDGPIEIELTAHAPAAERRHGADEPAVADEPVGVGESGARPTPVGSERMRLLATIGVVAVIAMAIGWVVGRSTDGGRTSTDATAASVGRADENASADGDGDATFDAAEELPDAASRFDDIVVADTVTPPIPIPPAAAPVDGEPVEITIDERVIGLEAQLVALDGRRRLIQIDLASAEVSVRGDEFVVSPDEMIAGPDWIASIGYATQSVDIDFDAGGRSSVSTPDPWAGTMVDRQNSTVWTRAVLDVEGRRFEERTFDDELTGRTIELPTGVWPQVVEDGAIVTSIVGSVFRVDPDGPELIGRGELMELSPTTAIVSDCDDELRCGLVVIDRVSGDERWVPDVIADGESPDYFPLNGLVGRAGGSLSPDDSRLAVVHATAFGDVAAILDLETGELTDVADVGLVSNWTWGPDGRFAFFLEQRRPMAVDTLTNETFPLSSEPLSWTAFVGRARPPSPAG